MIDAQQFADAARIPIERAHYWFPHLERAMRGFDINTPQREAAFLAQTGHETGGFRVWVENLTYSTPEQIARCWPSRFKASPDDEAELRARHARHELTDHQLRAELFRHAVGAARPFVRSPIALANNVYANRLGNGSVASGDGYRFRGRGLIQITGRSNYSEAAYGLNLDLLAVPELLEDPENAAVSAAWWWYLRQLNDLADAGAIDKITRIVNGKAMLGRAERVAAYQTALETFA